ncbi:hypothetical protein BDB00DRAFT_821989 [Zychaea mexicana]|uniref:uncharacterized protein n=1 Tax=Zychaea mexicana TaxID=64656 RepID=UPI0022FDFFFB|nr:uncharacterized protein BDB00DRAFT_821989 [Zychaea mexicana]KAI9493651.1 hypothetical protein BDB00DRAFT_821989 [Zychaea mexicana]
MGFISVTLLPWITDEFLPIANNYLHKGASSVKDNWKPIVSAFGIITVYHLVEIRRHRYRYINELRQKYPDPSIALKDSQVAAKVFDIAMRKEFPALHYVAFNIALYRSVTIPSISRLLVATGEAHVNPQKREEDSYLLLHEMLDVYPHIQSERKKNPSLTAEKIEEQELRRTHAIARMNEIHSRYRILHGDFLYQLVLFVSEPIYWINKFGYRKLDELEMNAIYKMWADIADGMGLENYPSSAKAMIEYHKKYAAAHSRYFPTTEKVSESTINNTASHFPSWARPFVRMAFSCMITPQDCRAMGLPQASGWFKSLFDSYLYLHGYYVRFLQFPRKESYLGTPVHPNENNRYMPQYDSGDHPAYPEGYTINGLGPTKIKTSLCPMPNVRVGTCPVAHFK